MKKTLFFASVLFALASCGNSDKTAEGQNATGSKTETTDATKAPVVEWLNGTYQDLGKVVDGQVVEISYRFRNAGNANLIIENVQAGCGCTVPEKPEKPIAPGEEGEIKARFDSRGRKGPNEKTVTVTTNSQPSTHSLSFKVMVTE